MKNEKRKILYIHHGGAGGAFRSMLFLINEIKKSPNFEATVFLLRKNITAGILVEQKINYRKSRFNLSAFHGTTVSGMNLNIFLKNYIFLIPNFLYAFFTIKKVKPNILHLNSTCSFPYAIIAKTFFKKIMVVTHVREPLLDNIHGKILKYFVNKYSDYIIAINHFESKDFSQEKTKVIYNSLDTQKNQMNQSIRQKKRNELNISSHEFAIGTFCRINEKNGVFEVLKLAKYIHAINSNIQFHLFGYNENYAPLEIKKAIRKRTTNVFVYPMKVDVEKYFQAMDLVISCFQVPHYSRQIMEANSFGIPVIATTIESQKDLVHHNKTGFLYESGNYQEFYEFLTKLFNQFTYQEFSKNARNLAVEKFDALKNATQVLEIYGKKIKENR